MIRDEEVEALIASDVLLIRRTEDSKPGVVEYYLHPTVEIPRSRV